MIAQTLEALSLWRNPVFLRFCRSRLRLRKSIFWYLLTLIITTFVIAIIFVSRTSSTFSPIPPQQVARELWLPLLIIQGLILMLKGTGSVSAGLIQDKIDETLDYQRLTPITPLRNLAGYLFGLPVLEYVMFALTLPHLAFIVVAGQVPIGTVLSVYLAFFVCVILYHVMGVAAGMVMRRWILGYLLSILLVLIVNLILPTVISQLGLKFLQYLSVWPVIGQKVLPLIVSEAALASAMAQNPFFSGSGEVPFFVWTLSPYVFSFLLQTSLILTFGVMALRRWKSATKHSLSKPYALAFLAGFVVLLIGNLWPIITRQYMPFALFGETNVENLGEVVVVVLPLAYALVTWLLCFILLAIVIPTHHDYVRGVRRALKFDRRAARPWEDDAGSVAVMGLFALIALVGFAALFREISAAGFLDDFGASRHGYWRLPLALGLVLLYTALLVQVVELKPTVLVILLVWLLPILVAIVLGTSAEAFGTPLAVIAAVSPLALVVASGLLPFDGIVPVEAQNEFASTLTTANVGLLLIVLQIAWLWRRWSKYRRGYDVECRAAAAA